MTTAQRDIDRTFVLAGDAIFTVTLPADFAARHKIPGHYTFRVKHKPADSQWTEAWFVELLAGPDNTDDFDYVGKLDPQTGSVRLTRKSRYSPDAMVVRVLRRVLSRLWAADLGPVREAGFAVAHAGRCGRCGRTLTEPESIATGIGPVCRDKLG